MLIYIHHCWWLFLGCVGLTIIASIIMSLQGKHFYTMDTVVRSFTIFDLEFASNEKELSNVINGIFLLPPGNDPSPNQVAKALRINLFVDYFLFMPAAYGAIFLLCMKLGERMYGLNQPIVAGIFALLAWLQVIAFVLDGIENGYLLYQLRNHGTVSSNGAYKAFRWLEIFKWGIALVGAVCGLSTALYLWMSGMY